MWYFQFVITLSLLLCEQYTCTFLYSKNLLKAFYCFAIFPMCHYNVDLCHCVNKTLILSFYSKNLLKPVFFFSYMSLQCWSFQRANDWPKLSIFWIQKISSDQLKCFWLDFMRQCIITIIHCFFRANFIACFILHLFSTALVSDLP